MNTAAAGGLTVNADFRQRVVIASGKLPWIPSPQPGIERRMLDRIGGEIARATSLVRYAPHSAFPAHEHGLGEEFLVLDGVFSDEHGDYPRGTYVRNPPGSIHTPRTGPGCTIFVKLRQMPLAESQRTVIDTTSLAWQQAAIDGHAELLLHQGRSGAERVTMECLQPGATLASTAYPAGEELFVLAGEIEDEYGQHGAGTWLRNPPGFRHRLATETGAVYWAKRGHLRPLPSPDADDRRQAENAKPDR